MRPPFYVQQKAAVLGVDVVQEEDDRVEEVVLAGDNRLLLALDVQHKVRRAHRCLAQLEDIPRWICTEDTEGSTAGRAAGG